MLQTIIYVILGMVVIGTAIPVLWPLFVGTDTAIQAMTQTDTATAFFKDMWPIALLVLGLAIGAGVIFWALKKFNILQ